MTDSRNSRARGRPTSYLHKACLNCRRRKTGCDGERPTCRRCRLHPPRSLNPCTYSHAPVGGTISLQVEESIETMENRIYELEHQLELLNGQDPSKVFLKEPYSNQQLQGLAPEPDTWDNLMQFGGIPSPIEVGKSNICAAIPRPNLDLFLHHFARHPFFFLDPMQFQQMALLPDLLPRSLQVAVALWATHVSENPLAESVYSEEELLARTAHHIAREIAAGDVLPQRMLHMIQTEVLLSLYYLDYGRLLEANYHRAGASSLAFISGLHQLGASSQNLVVQGENIPIQMGASLRMEMINAFWSVLLINNYCVAASDAPSSMPYDAPINTPWPTHFPNVAPSSVPFLDEDGVTGHSPLTLLTKASIQLERTMSFTARNSRAGLPLPSKFWAIETRLERFRSRLPPVNIGHPTDQISLVMHAFVNVAILCLHSPYINVYAEARSKCLTAASCVIVRLTHARLAEWEIVDPILGPLLAAVAEVLIASLTHVPQASADLQATLSAMQTLARRSPLIQRYLTVTQHQYTAAQQSLGLFGLL
ncbi:hypothetical protein DFH08DRAFT_1084497 [Mycena albidolilacea]|uniref:Zn(2)-C6 fungal-type domain-containing protein n=1 Tax=Mycena albidolilacea TaxID=1033008 RepID=A0AAD6ZLX0_9AGAR|nr:hypothetical protein DFH08DRAFT_1084497 [Mycena albidolilacea]